MKRYLVRDIKKNKKGRRVGKYTSIFAGSEKEAAALFMKKKHKW